MENEIKKILMEKFENGGNKELFYSTYYNNEEIKKYFVEKIRQFLLTGTHSNSETRRILTNITPSNLQRIINRYYIFTRFYFSLGWDHEIHFNYCAGQDYISERKIMRNLIVKNY